MTIAASKVLKPGWLVIADIHNHGCSHYSHSGRREDVDENRVLRGEWHTEKRVDNIDEHKAVANIMYKATRLIARCGWDVYAGTYVPLEKKEELQEALIEARKMINLHNATSRFTRISGGFLSFLITGDNGAVAHAVINQAQRALTQLKESIETADVKGIREALRKGKRLEDMFEASQSDKLKQAFAEAKKTARSIVKISNMKGEELDAWTKETQQVDAARIAFAEIEVDAAAEVRLPGVAFRQVEMEE